jgi:DNA-binding GntR family transcriptional regulator
VDLTAITGRPKYLDLADDLRAKIANGTYTIGAELPSTSQLMQKYGVSVTVVRAAVRELRHEGLVLGQPGKAVYVQAEPSPSSPTPEYTEIMDQLRALRGILDDFDARLTRVEEATGHRSDQPRKQARSVDNRGHRG